MNPVVGQAVIEHARCAKDPRIAGYEPGDKEWDLITQHPIRWGQSKGKALHLRREMSGLTETIERSHRMLPMVGLGFTYSKEAHTWTARSGYKIVFSHCKDVHDYGKYQGHEYTEIDFDELTEFEQEQYDQICARLRTTDPVLNEMLKVRCTANPVATVVSRERSALSDPHWVRKRFVDPAPEGNVTLVRTVRLASGEEAVWDRIFVPARLSDNPDPEFRRSYEASLRARQPKHIVKALLDGSWNVVPGAYFGDDFTDRHTCRPFSIPSHWKRWRSMDWGFRAPGCVHWWAEDEDGTIYCYAELTFQGLNAAEVADRIREIERKDGTWIGGSSCLTGPADTQLWEERGDVAITKAATMAEMGVMWCQADKRSRASNAQALLSLIRKGGEFGNPGFVVFTSCVDIIRTLPVIGPSKTNNEEPADGGDDHWMDSACYSAAFHRAGAHGAISKHEAITQHRQRSRKTDDQGEDLGQYGYGGH
jgi:hypothetical protein